MAYTTWTKSITQYTASVKADVYPEISSNINDLRSRTDLSAGSYTLPTQYSTSVNSTILTQFRTAYDEAYDRRNLCVTVCSTHYIYYSSYRSTHMSTAWYGYCSYSGGDG